MRCWEEEAPTLSRGSVHKQIRPSRIEGLPGRKSTVPRVRVGVPGHR
jgi:hypothetical protein